MNDRGREQLALLLTDMADSEFGQQMLYDLEKHLQERVAVKLDPDETPFIAYIAAFRERKP
jgi:hypothetical protein